MYLGELMLRRTLLKLLALPVFGDVTITRPKMQYGLMPHQHQWLPSPFFVIATKTVTDAMPIMNVSVDICQVPGCGIMRVSHGSQFAGKFYLDQK